MPLQIPKLMLGTSPFIGAGQFGTKAYEYRNWFFHNERTLKQLFVAPARRGVNPVGYAMEPDYESTLRALETTDKPVIAIKSLAAGRLKPTQSLFTFVYKYAGLLSVGITSETEMEETYAVAKEASI